jgi:hypothetical protein
MYNPSAYQSRPVFCQLGRLAEHGRDREGSNVVNIKRLRERLQSKKILKVDMQSLAHPRVGWWEGCCRERTFPIWVMLEGSKLSSLTLFEHVQFRLR